MGVVVDAVRAALERGLDCAHLEVRNESDMHAGRPGRETHLRVIIVSPAFEGQTRIARHRTINALLAEQLAGPVHALAIEAVTPAQWAANGGPVQASPDCHGGSKG